MYAIIRAGGKQAKVHSGDVIEIERIKGDVDKLDFCPPTRRRRRGEGRV